MNGIFAAGVRSFYQAEASLQKGASSVARASSGGGDFVSGAVALAQARAQTGESVALIRTADEMQKTLLDVIA